VFYSSADITTDLANKMQGGSPVSTSIPTFDSFNSNLAAILPENMTSFNSDGIKQALNPTNMQSLLDGAMPGIVPSIESNTVAKLNSLKGINNMGTQAGTAFSQLESSNSQLTKLLEDYSKGISMQTISTLKNNNQISQLGTLNKSIDGSFPSFTPKGIRDLNDPAIFNEKKTATINETVSNVKSTSKSMTEQDVSNKDFNNSAQQNLQQLSTPQYSGDNDRGFDLFVRRTVYWAYGSGTDSDSAALRSSTGRQLQQGISVAVDPAVIPYLSKIEFPDIGTRYATDTGGAVKARTASGGKAPIIDVFFLKKEDALKFANSTPEYINVKVFPPKTKYRYAKNSSPTFGAA